MRNDVPPSRPAAPKDRIRVTLVEDDPEVLAMLARLLGNDTEFEFLGGFPNATEALKGIPRAKPDIVIMDINLPGMDGVECVRRLKEIFPGPQVLMLTVYEDSEAVFSALRAGATGYLLKQTSFAELRGALQEIYRGGSPMSSHIARKVVQSFQGSGTTSREMETLSQRERQVLELVSQGYLFKEVADKLDVGFATVHTYSRRIYEKLHVRSRAQAAAKYTKD